MHHFKLHPVAAIPVSARAGQAIRAIVWRHASPRHFYRLSGRLIPWLAVIAIALSSLGLYLGLCAAPADAQQGEVYRIIFIHVPAAWLSMLIYLALAFWAGLGLIMNTRLSSMMARALAPTGALFTFLALWTGALWGRPTWGAWWVWDARLTSELILLFFYIGFMALQSAIDDPRRGDRAGALLALVGVVNLPVIYFSVQWWNTLHQGSSLTQASGARMAPVMLAGMLVTALGLWAYAAMAALLRLRCEMLQRESRSAWVAAMREGRS